MDAGVWSTPLRRWWHVDKRSGWVYVTCCNLKYTELTCTQLTHCRNSIDDMFELEVHRIHLPPMRMLKHGNVLLLLSFKVDHVVVAAAAHAVVVADVVHVANADRCSGV